MALDEVLLSQAACKAIPPTFRLYAWDPPTLSLGYAQKASDVNLLELKNQGWDLIRRPTGGKAILHIDELTYSITAPVDEPVVSGSLLESYQRISAMLQKALEYLGVQTSADKQYENLPNKSENPICFEVPSNFEITCKNKKLIGSAQARKLGGVLQHGSLPLYGDLSRITKVLNYLTDDDLQKAKNKVLDRAITLSDSASRSISWEETASALVAAFITMMDVQLILSDPSSDEIKMADELVKTKYGTTSWNLRI